MEKRTNTLIPIYDFLWTFWSSLTTQKGKCLSRGFERGNERRYFLTLGELQMQPYLCPNCLLMQPVLIHSPCSCWKPQLSCVLWFVYEVTAVTVSLHRPNFSHSSGRNEPLGTQDAARALWDSVMAKPATSCSSQHIIGDTFYLLL